MAPRKSGRRRAGPRKGVRKARTRNPNAIGGPNTCKVVEVLASIPVNLNTPYLINKAGITGVRAPTEAKNFGLYRIAQIHYTVRPLYDTYSSSFAGTGNYPTSVPQLYWKLNRYGDFPAAFNADYMRALGAKPNRLDDKSVTWSYKPNILVAQNNAAGVSSTSMIKQTPWLSTDDRPADNNFTLSTAVHYGHTMFVEAQGAGAANGVCGNMDIRIVYEFKNPRVVPPAGMDVAQTATQTLSL